MKFRDIQSLLATRFDEPLAVMIERIRILREGMSDEDLDRLTAFKINWLGRKGGGDVNAASLAFLACSFLISGRRPSSLAEETITIANAPYDDGAKGAVSVTCPITNGVTLLDALTAVLVNPEFFARALQARAADGVCATVFFKSESGPVASAFCRVGDRMPSPRPAWNERVLDIPMLDFLADVARELEAA